MKIFKYSSILLILEFFINVLYVQVAVWLIYLCTYMHTNTLYIHIIYKLVNSVEVISFRFKGNKGQMTTLHMYIYVDALRLLAINESENEATISNCRDI